MSIVRALLPPLSLGGVAKREARTQFAALCYRRKKGAAEVLLITSLMSKRWIVPKGWPMDGFSPAEAAAQEAWEEAGVEGHPHQAVLGIYSYRKVIDDATTLPCVCAVFPLQVKRLLDAYPEAGQRKRKWFSPKKAAARVDEAELKAIIRGFDAARLR